jgi:hypothetical protein
MNEIRELERVLGPILFLLFINDFHKTSILLETHLFAHNLSYAHNSLIIPGTQLLI